MANEHPTLNRRVRFTILAAIPLVLLVLYIASVPGCHEIYEFEVDGVIVNEEGVPMSGAQVSFVAQQTSTTKSILEDGRFEFSHVFTSGEYELGHTGCKLVFISEGSPNIEVDVSPDEEPQRGVKNRVRVIVVKESNTK